MEKIIITERGQLEAATIKKLEDNGYIVIHAKDPSKVKMMCGSGSLETNDILMAAMHTVSEYGNITGQSFAKNLNIRLKEKENKK